MILFGPTFRDDAHMDEIRSLHNQDPSMILVLVAEEVTADLFARG
jgi:hypothetical protein